MTCREFEEIIWEYLLEDAEASKKLSIDKHLYSCDKCRAMVEEKMQFKLLLEEAMREPKLQYESEIFKEDIFQKLISKKYKVYWIQKVKKIKIKHIAMAIILPCVTLLSMGWKTTIIEKWVSEENKIMNISLNQEDSGKGDDTEIVKLAKRVKVSAPRSIDLGNNKAIIEDLKDKNFNLVSMIRNNGSSIQLSSGAYMVNYEIGQGYTMAVDLSKSSIDGLDKSFKVASPNNNYIICILNEPKKLYLINVKNSTITEINTAIDKISNIVWSHNEKYFAISCFYNNQCYALGGKIDDNGLVHIVSIIETPMITGISDEGHFSENDDLLRKIDAPDRIEAKDLKVIGDEELNNFRYYFANGKTIVIAEKYVSDKNNIFVCELKGKEVKVIKNVECNYLTSGANYNSNILEFYDEAKGEMVNIDLNDLSITKERVKVDEKLYEKGIFSPNYYSYLDMKEKQKVLIRKSADDSLLVSVDIPLDQSTFQFLNCDNILIMNNNISLKEFKIFKINVKTKKIEELK